MAGLQLDVVSVRYGDRLVVDRVSLRIAPGSWVAVVGPNGAGKSSLLKAVAGAVPNTGSVTIGPDVVGELSRRERARRVAYVPQVPLIPDGIRVIDYVLLGRTPHIGTWSMERQHDIEIAVEAMVQLDVEQLRNRAMGRLSGGERQRVVLARALAQEPEVMLLDEPTSALDIGHQQQVLAVIDELRASHGMAVLSAIHDLTLAAQYADELLLLDGGSVVISGTPDHVLTVPNLKRFSGASVSVMRDPDGGLVVVPRRQPTVTSKMRPIP